MDSHGKKVRVLIVDDSALVRQSLEKILAFDKEIEVIGTAADPFIAASKIARMKPDVITLDIEMPRMDGITFLHKIMTQDPIPVVICSALTEKGAESTLKALEYGAVDVITKPRLGVVGFFEEARTILCNTVKAAAKARIRGIPRAPVNAQEGVRSGLAGRANQVLSQAMIKTMEKVVVVGASTGGTEAISKFLESMPLDAPGIVIVQHMPEKFTKSFAKRLDGLFGLTVKEAEDGDSVIPGKVLIAPGNFHTRLKRSGARYFVKVEDGPLVCGHRPSVDVLFRSTARYAGSNAVGVIMTGMGGDGSQGLLEMRQAGAFTIAQDEASCIVFGMPLEAIKAGAVDEVVPLAAIGRVVMRECSYTAGSGGQRSLPGGCLS
ncbi:MAG: chemotaxis response regulator protein-glutamate methylesterase [Proteobacteria bacterium]|nr:chemotaxis response regulator protein-glutamate methylesterase [Pseudomonadota bacterium]